MGKHPSREADAEHLQAAFTAISPFSRMPDDVTVPRVGAAVAGAIRRGLPVTLTDIA